MSLQSNAQVFFQLRTDWMSRTFEANIAFQKCHTVLCVFKNFFCKMAWNDFPFSQKSVEPSSSLWRCQGFVRRSLFFRFNFSRPFCRFRGGNYHFKKMKKRYTHSFPSVEKTPSEIMHPWHFATTLYLFSLFTAYILQTRLHFCTSNCETITTLIHSCCFTFDFLATCLLSCQDNDTVYSYICSTSLCSHCKRALIINRKNKAQSQIACGIYQ